MISNFTQFLSLDQQKDLNHLLQPLMAHALKLFPQVIN
jgi:hypothetical protein